jgi:hypothetical protein
MKERRSTVKGNSFAYGQIDCIFNELHTAAANFSAWLRNSIPLLRFKEAGQFNASAISTAS